MLYQGLSLNIEWNRLWPYLLLLPHPWLTPLQPHWCFGGSPKVPPQDLCMCCSRCLECPFKSLQSPHPSRHLNNGPQISCPAITPVKHSTSAPLTTCYSLNRLSTLPPERFAHTVPSVWNTLPLDIWMALSLLLEVITFLVSHLLTLILNCNSASLSPPLLCSLWLCSQGWVLMLATWQDTWHMNQCLHLQNPSCGSLKKCCFKELKSENSNFISLRLHLLYTLSRITLQSLTHWCIHSTNTLKVSAESLQHRSCGRRNNAPKDVHALIPEPVNMLP